MEILLSIQRILEQFPAVCCHNHLLNPKAFIATSPLHPYTTFIRPSLVIQSSLPALFPFRQTLQPEVLNSKTLFYLPPPMPYAKSPPIQFTFRAAIALIKAKQDFPFFSISFFFFLVSDSI
jgi:hypothetical protein